MIDFSLIQLKKFDYFEVYQMINPFFIFVEKEKKKKQREKVILDNF